MVNTTVNKGGEMMAKHKSEQEGLQEFMTFVFGNQKNMSERAEQMRSGIYKAGSAASVGLILLALLLLNFTG